MRLSIYGKRRKWHNAKLAELPILHIVVLLGFSTLIFFVTANLVKLYIERNIMVAHGAVTMTAAIAFLGRPLLATGIAILLLFFSILAVRLTQTLGERWFP